MYSLAQPLYQQHDVMRPWLWRVKHNCRKTYEGFTKLMQWLTMRKGTRHSYRVSQPICRDYCLQPSALYLSRAWHTDSAVRVPCPKQGGTKLWINWRDNPAQHITFKWLAIEGQKYHLALWDCYRQECTLAKYQSDSYRVQALFCQPYPGG